MSDAPAITRITVSGFKSIGAERSIDIRPLTLLAGANSSGKSSIMQPLLLLKQTLELKNDPGPLWIGGPNVVFSEVEDFVSVRQGEFTGFDITITIGERFTVRSTFETQSRAIVLRETEWITPVDDIRVREGDVDVPDGVRIHQRRWGGQWRRIRDRCFLHGLLEGKGIRVDLFPAKPMTETAIQQLVHLPGIRGLPGRNYPRLAVGPAFEGVFHPYTGSVVIDWEAKKDKRYSALIEDMKLLRLVDEIYARPVDATQVQVVVDARETNIADVGLGVSQALPIAVSLNVAQPGQMVYIEQPELHLHPRAQGALAEVLARAAQRGVHVVAETHSAHVLLGVQSLVAEGKLDPKLVRLHWFTRDQTGQTNITSADLDEAGRFGDWPEDFGQVDLEAESRYLDAVEARHAKE